MIESVHHQGSDCRASVLVVEDEPFVRLLISDILHDNGFDSLEVIDAESALVAIGSGRHFDIMITDIGLPRMDGRVLALEAKRMRPGLKILFVTGYESRSEGSLDEATLAPFEADVVTKPFLIGSFVKRIETILNRPTPH